MNRKERLEYVRQQLEIYDKEIKSHLAKIGRMDSYDPIGWIALKLGCLRDQAEKIIVSARVEGKE